MCDPRMPGCFLLRALCDVWTVEWRTIDALRALLCGPFYWAIFGLDLMLIFLVPNDRADLSRSGSTQRATTGGSPDPKTNGIPQRSTEVKVSDLADKDWTAVPGGSQNRR